MSVHYSNKIVLTDSQILLIKNTPPKYLPVIDHPVVKELSSTIGKADVIFLFTGLGGEIGSYITPGIAELCQRLSDLVVVSAALPFSVEGKGRKDLASKSLANIRKSSHLTITYPNDGLLKIMPNYPLVKALKVMDNIMIMPTEELSHVLTVEDLPVLRDDFKSTEIVRLGAGTGYGDNMAMLAVEEALSAPWLDFDLGRINAVMVTMTMGAYDESMTGDVLRNISNRIPGVKIRYATRVDPSMSNKLRVMLLLGA